MDPGGANYSAIAPHRSYIDIVAQGFSGKPRLLAELLLHLAADDAKYSSFFWWKDFYRVDNSPEDRVQGFCQICQQLHEDNQVDIKQAFNIVLKDSFISRSLSIPTCMLGG